MHNYDVVVAGGSVSGLFAAREIAISGFKVCVLEEDHEIGTPEHCGGVISMTGLNELGILPSIKSAYTDIKEAEISSLNHSFTVSAKNQKVLIIDRREFDKQIAFQAQRNGADIRTMCRVVSINHNDKNISSNNPQNIGSDDKHNFIIKTNNEIFSSKFFIDARGISSLIQKNRKGVLLSAQYEVYSKNFESDKIRIKFDSVRFPGFFAWVIPTGYGKAKVGVAGNAINAVPTIKRYLDEICSSYSTIRKIFAPIWVAGPTPGFIRGRYVIVGDAAGQTKPTTAGGIYSCGMGGILAGRSISQYLHGHEEKLFDYEKNWFSKFGPEFEKMLLFRKLIERLDNRAIDKIFDTISKSNLDEISNSTDFDFHSSAISKILGIKGITKILNALVGNELRRIF